MTAITLPNTGIQAGFVDSEDNWGASVNRTLRILDALTQPRVIDKDLAAPPSTPTSGSVYIVGVAPTGAWATHAGHLAIWAAGDDITAGWIFVIPKSGWRVWVVDETAYYMHSGTAWTLVV